MKDFVRYTTGMKKLNISYKKFQKMIEKKRMPPPIKFSSKISGWTWEEFFIMESALLGGEDLEKMTKNILENRRFYSTFIF